jgi:uncharacterized lipoprotein YehR (DUF1307 family)
MMTKLSAAVAASVMAIALTACGGGAKGYDIAPIFPLSSDKCARYNGDQEGSGITASCMVSKSECQRAAADWRNEMRSSGVNDALNFTCE